MCASAGIDEASRGVLRREIGRRAPRRAERRARTFVRRSCPADPRARNGPSPRAASGSDASPRSDRRASTPGSSVADPHVRLERRRVFGFQVVRAVLQPHEVAGRVLRRLVVDVRPKPSCGPAHRRPCRAAMRTRLWNAWNATCASSAQHCTEMSPSLRSGSRFSPPPNGGMSTSGPGVGARARAGRAPVVDEHAATEADGDREVRARDRPIASPVSSGAASAFVGSTGPTGSPRSARSRRSVHSGAASRSASRSCIEVERAVEQALLRGRDDPGLVRAVEGDASSSPRTRRRARRESLPRSQPAGRPADGRELPSSLVAGALGAMASRHLETTSGRPSTARRRARRPARRAAGVGLRQVGVQHVAVALRCSLASASSDAVNGSRSSS